MSGAGELRERLRFERRKIIPDDGYGNTEGAWQRIYTCAANVRPTAGSEPVEGQGLEGTNTWDVTIRWFKAPYQIQTGDRAVNERSGEIYNIRRIVNIDQRRRFLTLIVESGVAT